ncbi:MAG: ferritin-like domain-containing protein [Candidatus Binatia bacterium]
MLHQSELQLFQLYREAEYQGVELLQRLSRKIVDPRLQIELSHQIADETRHALLWSEQICAFGGTLSPSRRVPRRRQAPCSDCATAQLILYAQLYVAEERLQQQYRAHLVRSAQAPHIEEILKTILSDEGWHSSWVTQMLAKQEQCFGRTRVAAIINSFWNA